MTSKPETQPLTLEGTVVKGDQRGRELGYPTANIDVGPDTRLPEFGVYASWAWVDGRRLPSATSIGRRPQFDGDSPTVETYIFDFDGDLYGRSLKIELVAMVSPEMKFETIELLKQKIAADVAKAREILKL
jgi:riboflavin kinase/FMN adenylyltransferase